jgi:hypothetical protein
MLHRLAELCAFSGISGVCEGDLLLGKAIGFESALYLDLVSY